MLVIPDRLEARSDDGREEVLDDEVSVGGECCCFSDRRLEAFASSSLVALRGAVCCSKHHMNTQSLLAAISSTTLYSLDEPQKQHALDRGRIRQWSVTAAK